jgi:hypothetical protein
LDSILSDMAQPVGSKPRLSKASRIIDFWKAQWGWSQVDVARALMHILPGATPAARRPAIPESTGREFIWSDLPSIAAALEAHKLGCQSASSTPVAPTARAEALLETISFVGEESPSRPRPRTSDAKRASARFDSQHPAHHQTHFRIPSIYESRQFSWETPLATGTPKNKIEFCPIENLIIIANQRAGPPMNFSGTSRNAFDHSRNQF